MIAAEKGRLILARKVETAGAAIETCKKSKPDLLILDLNLPDDRFGQTVSDLKRLCPGTRTLVSSRSLGELAIITALRGGVEGFIETMSDADELRAAINRLARGENYLCARSSRLLLEIARRLWLQPPQCTERMLSTREKEILALIVGGYTNKEIAERLSRSLATVDTHRRNLMGKIGARNAADAVVYAIKHHLSPPAVS